MATGTASCAYSQGGPGAVHNTVNRWFQSHQWFPVPGIFDQATLTTVQDCKAYNALFPVHANVSVSCSLSLSPAPNVCAVLFCFVVFFCLLSICPDSAVSAACKCLGFSILSVCLIVSLSVSLPKPLPLQTCFLSWDIFAYHFSFFNIKFLI